MLLSCSPPPANEDPSAYSKLLRAGLTLPSTLMKYEAEDVEGGCSAPAVPPLGLKALFEVWTSAWLCEKAADGCGVTVGVISEPTVRPPTPSKVSAPAIAGPGWRTV